jgi:hypothetical protein
LPLRHEKGQTRRNLEFILQNEPQFPGCEKRFILNRIVDPGEERAIMDLLNQAQVRYTRIPFQWEQYATTYLDIRGVPQQHLPGSWRYRWLHIDEKERIQARLYRYKNNYAMNNNGARNLALREGRARAKWIMPWDGNCFLTHEGFQEIHNTIAASPHIPYFLINLLRVHDNFKVFGRPTNHSSNSAKLEEPQLIFRQDAQTEFNTAYPYGRRPKVELLWRLAVPGPWDYWGIEPWDLPCPAYDPDAGAYAWAGTVLRLATAPTSQSNSPAQDERRSKVRTRAILHFLDYLDHLILCRGTIQRPELHRLHAKSRAHHLEN